MIDIRNYRPKRIPAPQYKIIVGVFCAYPDTKKQYIEARNDILLSSPAPPNGMPRGGQTSNPTHAKVVSLTRLQEMERQIRAVEQVLYEFDFYSEYVKQNLWDCEFDGKIYTKKKLTEIVGYHSDSISRIKSKFMERLGYVLGVLG